MVVLDYSEQRPLIEERHHRVGIATSAPRRSLYAEDFEVQQDSKGAAHLPYIYAKLEGECGLSRPHLAVLDKALITRKRLSQITDQAMRDLLDFARVASRLIGNLSLQLLKPNKLEPAPSDRVGMGIGLAKTSL